MRRYLEALSQKLLSIHVTPEQEERLLLVLKIVSITMIFIAYAAKSWLFVDPDFGWHLKTTQDYYTNSISVPRSDPYSYTIPTYLWVDHEWLGHVVLARLLPILPLGMISILAGILFALPFLYWTLRARSMIHIFFINCFAFLMIGIIGLRPQVYSFLLFFAIVEILDIALKKESRRLLLALVPLFLLWANTHGSFVGGLAYLSFYWIGKVVISRACSSFDRIFLAVIISCFGITFLNPYGIGMWVDIYRAFTTPYLKYIAEWQSGLLYASFSGGMLLGALFGIGRTVWKETPKTQMFPLGFLFVNYMQHVRIVTFFYTAIQPLLGEMTFNAEQRFLSQIDQRIRGIAISIMMLLAAAPIVFLSFTSDISSPFTPPIDEIRAYAANIAPRVGGRLFNDYGIGGAIIGTPGTPRVFIDGRMPHWVLPDGTSAMKDFVSVFYDDSDAWRDLFSRYDIRTVFINPRPNVVIKDFKIGIPWLDGPIQKIRDWAAKNNAKNLEQIFLDDGWCTVFKTPRAVIMVAPGELYCKHQS